MGPRRRKERQNGVENLFNDIRTGNFPSLREGKRYAGTGSTLVVVVVLLKPLSRG